MISIYLCLLYLYLLVGFRLYGAVSSLLERVVPLYARSKSAATVDGAHLDVMGYPLPAGTVVGMQAWSFHRDPSVFPDPEVFDPNRWLPAESDSKSDTARLGR